MVKQIIFIGEGMIELQRADDAWRLAHGGDTLNSAIHMARLGGSVAYATALGDDAFSADLRTAWAGEGIDTRLILTDPARQPGLYAIRTDERGERSFTYWRDSSAARGMFALPDIDAVTAAAERADLLCYSLISLAILPDAGRHALLDLARRTRAHGGMVAFDGNYRPRLWASVAEARAMRDLAIAACDIGLPTVEDEIMLSPDADAASVAAHWSALGAREVVVKLGADGCAINGGPAIAPPQVHRPVDTSGAGDAFNAGYLHARLTGADTGQAALAGHRLAGWVVMQRGAIPAVTADAPYGAPLTA